MGSGEATSGAAPCLRVMVAARIARGVGAKEQGACGSQRRLRTYSQGRDAAPHQPAVWGCDLVTRRPRNWREPRPPARSASLSVTPFLRGSRSEEHTSELQSPCNLVCRLLLEKKKEE